MLTMRTPTSCPMTTTKQSDSVAASQDLNFTHCTHLHSRYTTQHLASDSSQRSSPSRTHCSNNIECPRRRHWHWRLGHRFWATLSSYSSTGNRSFGLSPFRCASELQLLGRRRREALERGLGREEVRFHPFANVVSRNA